jgi:mRNA interferase RelE/StbE
MLQVHFTPTAENDLAAVDPPTAQRVLKKLHWLAENWSAVAPETLTAKWQGVFKLRVGDYRVLYTFDPDKQRIAVHFVRHRREVYR